MELDKPVIDAIVKGCSDKKVPFRRLWTIRLGELLWTAGNNELLQSKLPVLAEAVLPSLLDIWNEVSTNPLAAGQSGLVSAAYVFTTISNSKLSVISSSKVDAALKKAQIARVALTMEPKPSFLVNPRIYTKLSSEDEFRWFIRALSSLSKDVAMLDPQSTTAIGWSQAIIFCICSSTITSALRKDASRSLSQLYVHDPEPISAIVIAGLWQWRHSVESSEKDGTALSKTDSGNIHHVVQSICLPPAEMTRLGGGVSDSMRKRQMISMLVLSRPELLPRVSWIDLCLRVEVDPGELARVSGDDLIQQILISTDFDETVSNQRCIEDI
jgi:hypothetical protein